MTFLCMSKMDLKQIFSFHTYKYQTDQWNEISSDETLIRGIVVDK